MNAKKPAHFHGSEKSASVPNAATQLVLERVEHELFTKALIELAIEFVGKDRSRLQLMERIFIRAIERADLRPQSYTAGTQAESLDFETLKQRCGPDATTALGILLEKIARRLR
ncbi:hypothetical protein ACVCNR_00685 [Aquamicrobium terrae]